MPKFLSPRRKRSATGGTGREKPSVYHPFSVSSPIYRSLLLSRRFLGDRCRSFHNPRRERGAAGIIISPRVAGSNVFERLRHNERCRQNRGMPRVTYRALPACFYRRNPAPNKSGNCSSVSDPNPPLSSSLDGSFRGRITKSLSPRVRARRGRRNFYSPATQ